MEHRVILFLDKFKNLDITSSIFSDNGFKLFWAENEERGLDKLKEEGFDLILIDPKFSNESGFQILEKIKTRFNHLPVIIIEEEGSIQNAVEAMQKGAFDYLIKSYPAEVLKQRIEFAINNSKYNEVKSDKIESSSSPCIITQNKRMLEILNLCQKIASSNAPVLIQGESGTGKELIARYIHFYGPRRKEPFVAVNCAALPESLFESELFGHEKGAFTGALMRKPGKFELADQGTILLDEISEMGPYLQAKLLRVLQENEIDRVGGKQPIPINVRVIATTNKNLFECIEKGTFREDLFYRLNVIRIEVPPLRERIEDIEPLVQYFLKKYSQFYGKTFNSISKEAIEWLRKQTWRGNIRELKNVIERAVLTSSRNVLDLKDIHLLTENPYKELKTSELISLNLREMEKKMIIKALEQTNWNRTYAARILGISIRTLRNKLREYKENMNFADSG